MQEDYSPNQLLARQRLLEAYLFPRDKCLASLTLAARSLKEISERASALRSLPAWIKVGIHNAATVVDLETLWLSLDCDQRGVLFDAAKLAYCRDYLVTHGFTVTPNGP